MILAYWIFYKNYHGDDNVKVGDGTALPITHTGQKTLHTSLSKFFLHDVLLVPQLSHNLLSVRRFTHDNNCAVLFYPSSFSMKALPTQVDLARSNSHGSLYPFLCHGGSGSSPTAMLVSRVSPSLWHHRLGHPGLPVMSQFYKQHSSLFSSNKFDSFCHSCQLGKHSKLPFSTSFNVSTEPFHLIHSDVWQSPVVSFSGYKYYVLFIDDYSGHVWVYPMRVKCNVYDIFVHFKNMIEKQFAIKIFQFQCDSGGEFVRKNFQSLFSSAGI